MKTNIESGDMPTKPTCNVCGTEHGAYTGVSEPGVGPTDGDLTVCGSCGAIGKYAQGLTVIEEISLEELRELAKDKELWSMLTKLKSVVNRIRKRKGSPDITGGDFGVEFK